MIEGCWKAQEDDVLCDRCAQHEFVMYEAYVDCRAETWCRTCYNRELNLPAASGTSRPGRET
jgi:hypothetical protein